MPSMIGVIDWLLTLRPSRRIRRILWIHGYWLKGCPLIRRRDPARLAVRIVSSGQYILWAVALSMHLQTRECKGSAGFFVLECRIKCALERIPNNVDVWQDEDRVAGNAMYVLLMPEWLEDLVDWLRCTHVWIGRHGKVRGSPISEARTRRNEASWKVDGVTAIVLSWMSAPTKGRRRVITSFLTLDQLHTNFVGDHACSYASDEDVCVVNRSKPCQYLQDAIGHLHHHSLARLKRKKTKLHV